MQKLSKGEIDFILGGLLDDIRADGRGRLDFRPFVAETQFLSQTNGSSRLILDSTDVIVGVKAELGQPAPGRPDEGVVQVAVDLNSSAALKFEGKAAAALSIELTRAVERMVSESRVLDLRPLCLVPGKQVWLLYIDVLVLESAGNLLDAIMLAIRAALRSTALPKVTVVALAEENEYELQVEEDVTFGLDLSRLPICLTLHFLGAIFFLDATLEEEQCPTSRASVAVNGEGRVIAVLQGDGTLTAPQLGILLQEGPTVASLLLAELDGLLDREERARKSNPKQKPRGFFG